MICHGVRYICFMQKSSNRLLMEIRPITSHNFSSDDTEYYLINEDNVTLPVEEIDQVYETPPFPREKIRVFIDGTDVTRSITNSVGLQKLLLDCYFDKL